MMPSSLFLDLDLFVFSVSFIVDDIGFYFLVLLGLVFTRVLMFNVYYIEVALEKVFYYIISLFGFFISMVGLIVLPRFPMVIMG